MLAEFARRIWMLLRRRQFDADLDEEMRLHRELREQEKIERGLSPQEARYAAQRRFGNEVAVREESRDVWGWRWIEDLLQDLRYALRMLAKSPGFTAVVVLTLALGSGVNSAIFSFVDQLLLRPLPFPEADRLVALCYGARQASDVHNGSVSLPDYIFYRGHTTTLAALAAYADIDVAWRLGDHEGRLPGEIVGYNYFSVLGVSPFRGRWFLAVSYS